MAQRRIRFIQIERAGIGVAAQVLTDAALALAHPRAQALLFEDPGFPGALKFRLEPSV